MTPEAIQKKHRILRVTLHAHCQRLDASQYQEAIHRSGYGADSVLEECQPVKQCTLPHGQRAAHDVRVTAKVLGCRVNDNVCAQIERALQIGGGERVIYNQQRVAG